MKKDVSLRHGADHLVPILPFSFCVCLECLAHPISITAACRISSGYAYCTVPLSVFHGTGGKDPQTIHTWTPN